MKYNNYIMLLQLTAPLMCQTFYTPRAKCCYLLHRWPGPLRSRPHQWALWECRWRVQQCGAERRLLCRCSGTTLPRHPSRQPLWSPSVALLHHFSARPHPSPQQPGLQHGQSRGAGWAGRRGTGPEGHGRRPDLRPLHRQQYGIPWLPHQPRLMAGRNGPFPVLSLVEDCCGDTTKQTQKAFYISFYRPPRLVCFVTLGEEEKEEEKVWLSVPQQSYRWDNSRCAVRIKSSEEQPPHRWMFNLNNVSYNFLSSPNFILFFHSENETGFPASQWILLTGEVILSHPLPNKPSLSHNSYNNRATI